jgi:tRNA (adenine57-N1/adenine58-N1)-methyltransferase catalytic subunit
MATVQAGDIVQLVGHDKRYFIFRVEPGGQLHTNRGVVEHDRLIGCEWGVEISTHLHHPFFVLIPSTDDLIRDLKRSSQIMYPKDIGFILMKMAIHPGVRVVEAGTGSGGMTTVLAQMVGAGGHIYSYDVRADMQNLARKNLDRVGLADRVTFNLRDIAAGFDETDVDALFLDVPNPWDYMPQARQALKGGGFFGSILPTANQVSDLLVALRRAGFDFIEVCEVLIRYYKTVPARLRPLDRMIAHTGYLVFGRPVAAAEQPPAAEPDLSAEIVADADPDLDQDLSGGTIED